MQATRQQILDHLKVHGPTTVDQLAAVLGLSPVTVRHHLDILRSEELIGEPVVRRRNTRGRPQHLFALTDKAASHFPKRYHELAGGLLEQLKRHADERTVNVIFAGLSDSMLATAPRPEPESALPERLTQAVSYLNTQGYVARWQAVSDGFVIHTCNCPFEGVASAHGELCGLDARLISTLVGEPVERRSHLADGDSSCTYYIPSRVSVVQPMIE
ncbi:MAG TPA: ArsR family transcriptional regulator [Anaerolineales bacterium]|nr:ArsR family transcriptional regulator [Anaerolineales bacterium]